jgi:hypothetical protein
MPSIGDTKTIFGRTYVYSNPNQALGPGTWVLTKGEGSPSGNQQSEHSVYGQAAVAGTSIPIKRGMLVRINNDGKAEAAIATSLETSRVVGVATDSANIGQIVQYTQNTVFEFFNAISITDEVESKLEIGRPYYLSAVNEGKWTKAPDVQNTQNVILQCGTAVGDYYMAIDIQPMVEQDPLTTAALTAEAEARTTADALQVERLDALEAEDVAINSRISGIEADIEALEADTTAETLSNAALVEAKQYTDERMAGIPAIDYSIDYGEYA